MLSTSHLLMGFSIGTLHYKQQGTAYPRQLLISKQPDSPIYLTQRSLIASTLPDGTLVQAHT